MKINVTNTEKLNAAIKAAEGRATARTITAEKIVEILNRIKVPKARLVGTKVFYNGAESFANAYRFTPESTHFEAVATTSGWFVTDIHRGTCPNRSGSQGRIEYSKSAEAYILEKARLI